MKEAISLCGFNCGICPAYKPNLKSDEDRMKVDEGWKKFHKTKGWVYKEPFCNGCFNDPHHPLWSSCAIRKCVFGNNIENCGHCLDYPCPRISNMIHITKKIAERTKKTGNEDDFLKFALPYLGKAKLDEIHQHIIETTQATEYSPINTTTIGFPSKLNNSIDTRLKPKQFEKALHNLHSTIDSIMTLHCRTLGGQEQELKRNKENAKFLWIVGRYGKLKSENNDFLIGITATDIKQYLRYGKHKLQKKLVELAQHGIETDYSDVKATIKFSEIPETALILQKYINSLLENYKERTAYTRFWKADMSVFT